MRRALRIGGLLAAVVLISEIIVLAGAEENPFETGIGLRNFLRDCDWKRIVS
jgi:hypothetical protein